MVTLREWRRIAEFEADRAANPLPSAKDAPGPTLKGAADMEAHCDSS